MALSRTAKTAAILASGLMGVGVLVAAPAHAYPPSGDPVTGVNRTTTNPGGNFKASATNVAAGCLVQFQVRDANGKRVSSSSGNQGDTTRTLRAPNRSGSFFVSINVYGANCPPANRRSDLIPMTAN